MRYAARYEAALDSLFDTYSALLAPSIAFVRARTPRDAETSERAYNSATRAKACDLLRGLLPMAVFAVLGSSRHLVVAADSATAVILAAALTACRDAGLAGAAIWRWRSPQPDGPDAAFGSVQPEILSAWLSPSPECRV